MANLANNDILDNEMISKVRVGATTAAQDNFARRPGTFIYERVFRNGIDAAVPMHTLLKTLSLAA